MSGMLVCVWLPCCGCGIWSECALSRRKPASRTARPELSLLWLPVGFGLRVALSCGRCTVSEWSCVGRFHDARLRRTAYRYKPPAAVWARWLGTHPLFRAYIIGLVVLSSLVLAVQVELPPERWEAHRAIERMELFILLSFIVEIGQRQTHWLNHVHTSDDLF